MLDFVRWFRDSSPYINAHQGQTFVLYLDGQVMAGEALAGIVSDIALLTSLGVHLVVVTGAQPAINAELDARGIESRFHNGLRITNGEALQAIQSIVGRQRIYLESLLSVGLPNTPMHNSNIQVVSGNYVIGRPLGVIEGVDFCYTGAVRRVNCEFIRQHLNAGALVHLTCLGYSITGEVFNIAAEEVATDVAIALSADKLIFLASEPVLEREKGVVWSELGWDELKAYKENLKLAAGSVAVRRIDSLLRAVQSGVQPCHLLDYRIEGVLLRELFTHEGCGSQISLQRSNQVRTATLADIGGILELIKPLEQQGSLVRRSRALLEQEIDRFMVTELDGLVTGCAALYPVPDEAAGELACLVTHPDYQKQGEGEALLVAVEQAARKQGLTRLFVLTTQAMHWFMEQGFQPGELLDLPKQHQALYNFQRGSKVLVKPLALRHSK